MELHEEGVELRGEWVGLHEEEDDKSLLIEEEEEEGEEGEGEIYEKDRSSLAGREVPRNHGDKVGVVREPALERPAENGLVCVAPYKVKEEELKLVDRQT